MSCGAELEAPVYHGGNLRETKRDGLGALHASGSEEKLKADRKQQSEIRQTKKQTKQTTTRKNR